MGQPFPENVTPGGILVYPSVRSPNFVHSISGWSINVDGSAEFNNLEIRGTFNGTNFVINSSGAFFYSSTPAAGNLVVSIASAAGTDGFGNSYPQGIQIGSSGNQAQVQIVPGSGGNPAEIKFPLPGIMLSNTPNMAAGISGSTPELVISGPALAAAGDEDWVQIQMVGNNGAGSPAGLFFNYINTSGGAGVIASTSGDSWSFASAIPVTVEDNLTVNGILDAAGGQIDVGLASITATNFNMNPPMGVPPNYPLSTTGTDTNSGSTFVSGERAQMNSLWSTPINEIVACLNSLISEMQNRGLIS